MPKTYLLQASIVFNSASILLFSMVLFDSGESTFLILSEFPSTNDDFSTKLNKSEKFELSELKVKLEFVFNFWLIEEYNLSFECRGLLQTKLFGSKSDSTSFMNVYNVFY